MIMKETELRKRKVFNKYLELTKKDAERFFNPGDFMEVKCPACSSGDSLLEFEKTGFKYVLCKKCSTLFVNPRPPFKSLKRFYTNSSSADFWINEFFKPVAEARREKIFRPRAEYISKIIDCDNRVIGDVGAGFGLFLEELKKIVPSSRYLAIEPSEEMSGICRKKGLEVICASLEDLDDMQGEFDLLTAFELAEHLFDPEEFFKKVYSLLRPGGYFFMTTLNGRGFDILLLWERSKSIAPPHHLNFFNISSIRIPLEKAGFEITEIETPGRLDWDIVENMIKDEHVKVDRLWEMLAYEGSMECKMKLQDWISRNKISSHMRIVARKRK